MQTVVNVKLWGDNVAAIALDLWASANHVPHEYGVFLIEATIGTYESLVNTVGHKEYRLMTKSDLPKFSNGEVLLFDIKGVKTSNDGDFYWKL